MLITIINVATPRRMPVNANAVFIEMNFSFLLEKKKRPAINFSNLVNMLT